MDANQWPLGLDVLKHVDASKQTAVERKPRPQKDQVVNCPRCNSTNTKFCYYNNYSLSQPRYFCKTCRRYWTEGGTLRNVPVGGGSRKNKRSSSSSSSSFLIKKFPDLTSSGPSQHPTFQNPKIHGGQDLDLAYNHNPAATEAYNTSCMSGMLPLSFGASRSVGFDDPNPNVSSSHLMSRASTSKGLMSLVGSMPLSADSNTIINSAFFPSHEYFRPQTRFSFCVDGQLDHMECGNSMIQQQGPTQQTNARGFHPYEEAKEFMHDRYEGGNKGQGESSGYWSGMLGAGSW